MEGYDLFSDDLPSLGSSMLEGLAELGGTGAGADQQQYSSSNQGERSQLQTFTRPITIGLRRTKQADLIFDNYCRLSRQVTVKLVQRQVFTAS